VRAALYARLRAKSDRAWHNELRCLWAGKDRRRKYWARESERIDRLKWRPLRRDIIRARKAMQAD